MDRPTCVILVGPPGCGKSTYGKKYAEEHANTIVLSSDQIREELYGDASIQDDPALVFGLMQSRTIKALNNGQNVVYDATNVTRKDRVRIIAACPKFVKIECHIIWETIATCIERDAIRERTVGKEVIDRMLKRFQAPYYDEGIHEIKIITPDDWNGMIAEEYKEKLWENMNIPHDNPNHTLNIQDHCTEACKYVLKHYPSNDDLLVAACWHDVGKPHVKAFIDTKGNECEHAHYYQHQCVGAWMVYGLQNIDPLHAWLVSVHMELFFDSKYYQKLPAYLKTMVDRLHEADKAAH